MTKVSFTELQRQRPVSGLGIDPGPWYKQMRMSNPVAIDEENTLCEVFRYKDVQTVLADATRFSVEGTLDAAGEDVGSIATMDPPRHNKMRALVSQAFTPRAIAGQAGTIRTITNELLDDCAASDTLELIQDFATPLPMRVIAGMLGVPLERRNDFKRWTQEIISPSPEVAMAAYQAFVNYMGELIEEKRKERQDDVISALFDAQVNGEVLSKQEMITFCVALLGAGFETTQRMIGNLMLCLDDYPESRRQVWADPSLVSTTVEEGLRFRPVAPRLSRVVKKDTKLGGKSIPAGYYLFAWLGSANRDEEQWKDPDVFDIHRSPNPHLEFGYGIHVCLGMPLARLELTTTLEQFIERFKDVQVIRDEPLQVIPSFGQYGLSQLPLRVQKR
ncbi:MAG: cytochrome P450 [Ktedonobacteraceae bacterium]|nr:cytochrome P450 [Ktedonobacteraceae bacterium]